MRKRHIAWAVGAALIATAFPASAMADDVEVEVPWAQGMKASVKRASFGVKARAAQAAPDISGLRAVGNSDKDGVTNSDIAFWGGLAYAGNYGGFRILDIRGDQPIVLSDFACNGAQSDPTVYDNGERRLLFQSVDSRQSSEDCASTSQSTPRTGPTAGMQDPGFEGIRIFDVTNPQAPRWIDSVETDCGSHTNTLIPDLANDRVFIYVSSYPLGSGQTPPATEPGQTECIKPHKKISILTVPFDVDDESDVTVKEQPLSSDTAMPPGAGRDFQACHDITAVLPANIAVGSCAGDGQIWDISDPANPTTTDAHEGQHTHIKSPGGGDNFEFIHTSMITPDLKRFVLTDETGGGGRAECDGAATDDGFYYFYKLVRPGAAEPGLISRFTIPRAQTPEICVSHNGNFIPVRNRYIMPTANYMGGTSVVDWTNERKPREVAFADQVDAIGAEDAWSSYWYNGRIYTNGGIMRGSSNPMGFNNPRGLDVFEFTNNRYNANRAAPLPHLNPQTVETSVR
jgi:hypothetical protein